MISANITFNSQSDAEVTGGAGSLMSSAGAEAMCMLKLMMSNSTTLSGTTARRLWHLTQSGNCTLVSDAAAISMPHLGCILTCTLQSRDSDATQATKPLDLL